MVGQNPYSTLFLVPHSIHISKGFQKFDPGFDQGFDQSFDQGFDQGFDQELPMCVLRIRPDFDQLQLIIVTIFVRMFIVEKKSVNHVSRCEIVTT